MTYLDKLKEHLSEKGPDGQPPKPPKPGFSGFGGSSGGHISPAEALALCRKALAALDPAKPLHGLDAARWRQLLDDSGWLLEHFAPQAFRGGWTVGELFGLWWCPGIEPQAPLGPVARELKPAWGGIADRLQGARSLKMTADRAHWRRMFTAEPDQFNRTAYPDLRPLWEPQG